MAAQEVLGGWWIEDEWLRMFPAWKRNRIRKAENKSLQVWCISSIVVVEDDETRTEVLQNFLLNFFPTRTLR